jgi:hypothetical protein
MLPDWNTIQGAWPLIAGIAALWARLEVALSRARDQSKANEAEIGKLEVKFDNAIKDLRDDAKVAAQGQQQQAVQLGRIEESLIGIGRTLERLDKKMGD